MFVGQETEQSAERDPHEVKALSPDQVVEEFTGLVTSIVHKLHKKLRVNIERDDLMAYGFRGLLDAHDRFDPSDSNAFASYAYYRIRGSVLDGCRKEGWLTRARSRDEAEKTEALNDYLESAHEAQSAAPRPTSLDDALRRVDDIVTGSATVLMVQEAELETLLTEDEPQARRREAEDNRKMLKAGLDELDDVEFEVVERYYFKHESMSEIGESLGHTKSWVSRIHTRAIEKMRDLLMQPVYFGPGANP